MLLLAALPHAKHVSQTVSSCCKVFFDKRQIAGFQFDPVVTGSKS